MRRRAHPWSDPGKSMPERFELYLEANRDVYEELVRMSYRWLNDPRKPNKVGMDYFIAAIRWNDPDLVVKSGAYLLNDRFTCFFARLIMKSEPPLDGLFELRTAIEADVWINDRDPEERVNA